MTKKFLLMMLLLGIITVFLTSCLIRGSGRVRVATPTVHVQANVPPPPPPSGNIEVQIGQPQTATGVVVIQPGCNAGAQEVLNGIDDNCNGLIDEGFVQSGAIQITLGWNTGADMDLYVHDPMGQTIYYGNKNSSSGGMLDRDARGACTDGQTVENVYWPSGNAPRGTYSVEVHYFSSCSAAGPTPVTLSIAAGGQIVGVYQLTLSPEQRVTMATFTIP